MKWLKAREDDVILLRRGDEVIQVHLSKGKDRKLQFGVQADACWRIDLLRNHEFVEGVHRKGESCQNDSK